MANTFNKIATVTVGSGGASTIDFNSIPSTFTDLVVLMSARSNRSGVNDLIYMKPNSATTGNSRINLLGDGSSVASYSGTNFETGVINATGSTSSCFSNLEIYICNYANTSKYKSWSTNGVIENNGTTAVQTMYANLWSSTSAITSLSFDLFVYGPFLQYSTATLYGIKNS